MEKTFSLNRGGVLRYGKGKLITHRWSGKRNGPAQGKYSFAKELTKIEAKILQL
jgi:hypothetical protein